MIYVRVIALAYIFIWGSLPGWAGDGKLDSLILNSDVGWLSINKNTSFKVFVIDNVDGGCWTNKEAVKTVLELEIKRSGYRIAGEKDFFPVFVQANTTGYKLPGSESCVVSYDLSISVVSVTHFGPKEYTLTSLPYRALWRLGGILSGPKAQDDFRIKEQYVDLVQKFLNAIDSQRSSIVDEISKSSYASEAAKAHWATAIK